MTKRGRGRPRKPRYEARVRYPYRDAPTEIDASRLAEEIRHIAEGGFRVHVTPMPHDIDVDPLTSKFIAREIDKAFRQFHDDNLRRTLQSLADAVASGDAARAGFFACEALRHHELALLETFKSVLSKGLRAVAADQKRSRMQKIRRG